MLYSYLLEHGKMYYEISVVQVEAMVALILAIVALVTVIGTSFLFLGKLRWEQDKFSEKFKDENTRVWKQLEKNTEAILAMQLMMTQPQKAVEHRLLKLEEQVDQMRTALSEIMGELKTINVILDKREKAKELRRQKKNG